MKFLNLFVLASFLCAAPLTAKVKVVTTTEDLAALAREVAGDSAEVTSIARGYQDPHFVEAKPSYLLKLKGAALISRARTEAVGPGATSAGIGILRAGPASERKEGCEILENPPEVGPLPGRRAPGQPTTG